MSKKSHIDIIKQGVDIWNKWRAEHPDETPNLFNENLCFFTLIDADFRGVNLWEAKLRKARLWRADLQKSDLCFCDLSGAELADARLKEANLTEADLSGSDFSRADLRLTNLWGANLTGANLTDADLAGANLSEADLTGADLRRANLSGVNFSEAKLVRTDLRHADLSKANLNNVDVTDAVMAWSLLGDVDISAIRGLHTIRHLGPSTIGIDTLYRSRGSIPEAFLKGVGVPGDFLKYKDAVGRQSAQYNSFFIRCASDDLSFAAKLHADLLARGVRCWMLDDAGVNGAGLKQSIRFIDRVLIVFSKSALDSAWMEDELAVVLEEERRRKHPISFPLALDTAVMKANAAQIQEMKKTRQIGNFMQWADAAAYEKSLNRLLTVIGYETPPDAEPSAAGDVGSKAARIAFPEAVYRITEENDCPIYSRGDEFRLSNISFMLPEEKPACVVLADDMAGFFADGKDGGDADKHTFRCSGCTGTIALERKPAEDAAGGPSDESDAVTDLVRGFAMFESLNRKEIKYLVSHLRLRQFNKGDVILKKGDPGRYLFIVVSGKVEVLGDGGMSIAFMGKGEVFGEMSLLSGNPVGATIMVAEPTSLLYLKGKDFNRILQKFPSLQMYFTRLLASRLNEIHDVRSKEFASGMVGKLSEMPPTELFQILNMSQKTGSVIFELQKGKAFASFRDGALINAAYGDAKKKDAFYAIMQEKQGRFKFIPGLGKEDMKRPELGEFMSLLMEGTRRMDEDGP